MRRYQTWRDALQVAPTVDVVNDIAAGYIDAIRPVLGELPPDCRRALSNGLDIQSMAVTLLQAELRFTGSPEQRELLHEIAHTLASAAVRVTQLHMAAAVPHARTHGGLGAGAAYGEA